MSNPPHCRPNNIRREMGLQGVSPRERLLLKKRKLFDIEATAVKRITKKKNPFEPQQHTCSIFTGLYFCINEIGLGFSILS